LIVDGIGPAERKKRLYDEIVHKIERMVERGELKVGDRLPAERHLARTFKVSRNCIRQAIQALAQRGLLESRRGDGTYLCAPDPSVLIDSLASVIEAQREFLKEILEFRLLLEPQIAALAARNISREELDRLKVIVCDQERKSLAGIDDGGLDAAFHMLLAQACQNRVIRQVAGTVNGILNETRSESLQSEARRRVSIVGHLRIIDALEARSPQAAFRAMREHIIAVEREIFGPVQQAEGGWGEESVWHADNGKVELR
jgi:GntR family transcriptional regulator, transcriptional repressor for pyruvate dehydrogenase complex